MRHAAPDRGRAASRSQCAGRRSTAGERAHSCALEPKKTHTRGTQKLTLEPLFASASAPDANARANEAGAELAAVARAAACAARRMPWRRAMFCFFESAMRDARKWSDARVEMQVRSWVLYEVTIATVWQGAEAAATGF